MNPAHTMLTKLLASPVFYDLAQYLIRGPRFTGEFVRRFVKPKPRDRVLDIGCGTGAMVPQLSGTTYIGFDMNCRYIDACRRRYSNRGSFHCETLTTDRLADFGTFDIVLAVGVLHHLNDGEAAQLFRLARESLVPQGKLVTLDGVFHEGQPPLVKWLLQNDRGKYVRTAKEYLRLARSAFGSVDGQIVDDLFRVPYTVLIMNCER